MTASVREAAVNRETVAGGVSGTVRWSDSSSVASFRLGRYGYIGTSTKPCGTGENFVSAT
jgi:hypothetical protein